MINSTPLRTYTNSLGPTAATSTASAKSGTGAATNTGAANAAASTHALGEKVTISDKAKATLANSQTAYDAIANNPDPTISVQQYAIPEWYAAGLVDTATLPGSPGYSANDNSNSSKIMAADENTRSEYFKLFESHFNKIMSANSINNQEDYYNAMIADSAKSENLHQQFKESIGSDMHLTELMQKMGISIT